MKCSNSVYWVGTALALATTVVASPVRAAVILLGSDYFQTASPTFFVVPNGYPNAGQTIPVEGLPIGPGTTDTIVQRQDNCIPLNLATVGSSCTIPIEMVALSLVAVNDPMLRFRESPTLASTGMMTMFSNGSGTGGTFDSFLNVFIEVSMDGGNSFTQFDWNLSTTVIDPLHLISTGANWTTIEHGLLVDGLIGDQNANNHTDKINCPSGFECPDFYLLGGGVVTEVDVLAKHTAQGAVPVPEPASLPLLGIGLAGLGALRRRNPIRLR